MIAFDKETCTDFETALSKEWLETNGLGGFASSTITGCNTRRSHGLLIASTHPPLGQMVLVNSLEEQVVINGTRYDLSCHQYPKVVYPRGDQHLVGFSLDPWPIWTYRIQNTILEKTVTMIHGQQTTIVTYRLRNENADAELMIRPFLSGRQADALHHENTEINSVSVITSGVVTVRPYDGVPSLYFHHNAKEYTPGLNWYRQLEYQHDAELGSDFREDCWSPGEFSFSLRGGQSAILILTTEGEGFFDAEYLLKQERERRRGALKGWEASDDVTHHLLSSAEQFVVRTADQEPAIVGGYPLVTSGGRDILIALPGLLLVTQRFDEAREILESMASSLHHGLLPSNTSEQDGEMSDQAVDTSLWFIVSIFHYLRYTRDFESLSTTLWPTMKDIVRSYEQGTQWNIRMDSDGLLVADSPDVALTWMNTPRSGKAVEVQALWYNALRIMQQLAEHFDEKPLSAHYEELAERAWTSIDRDFWNEEGGYLYDVIREGERDASFRPNQIFAVSLPFDSVSPDKAQRIVSAVEDRLLTPFGLRTLATSDARYAPRYEGDAAQRSSALHQGTIFAWLMGPFLTAYQKINGRSPKTQSQIRAHLALLLTHLWEAGLGNISEIFDAEMPHDPRGAFAQATSVAEVLRVMREELGTSFVPPVVRQTNTDSHQPTSSGVH